MPATSPSGSRSFGERRRPRALGEEPGRVEDERELRDLGRLEGQRTGAEPAGRAVDGDADAGDLDEHEAARTRPRAAAR